MKTRSRPGPLAAAASMAAWMLACVQAGSLPTKNACAGAVMAIAPATRKLDNCFAGLDMVRIPYEVDIPDALWQSRTPSRPAFVLRGRASRTATASSHGRDEQRLSSASPFRVDHRSRHRDGRNTLQQVHGLLESIGKDAVARLPLKSTEIRDTESVRSIRQIDLSWIAICVPLQSGMCSSGIHCG